MKNASNVREEENREVEHKILFSQNFLTHNVLTANHYKAICELVRKECFSCKGENLYIIYTLPVMNILVILYSVLVNPLVVPKFRSRFQCINFATISRDIEMQTTELMEVITKP